MSLFAIPLDKLDGILRGPRGPITIDSVLSSVIRKGELKIAEICE